MRLYGARGEWTDRPEITIVGTEHLELPGVRLRRIDRLEPRDVGRRAGFPTLSPALGLLLLGASVSAWKVSTAVHDLVFQGFTNRPRLVDVLARYGGRGRRGTTAFRKAVKSLDPNGRATQTNLELKLLAAIQAAGLPPPLVQHIVVDGDGRNRRLDLAWPDRRVDVETDGDRWHLNPADRAEMATRDAALARAGWRTERVDAGEVDVALSAVLARLGALL
jgi:very-short-patch-repair endonuclease